MSGLSKLYLLSLLSLCLAATLGTPQSRRDGTVCPPRGRAVHKATNCFPAIGFKMPLNPPSSLDDWWCSEEDEYAFLGFSYEVTACQSLSQLKREFADIKNRFNGRYVRLYGACDNNGFYDNVVEAAWSAGVGIHALVWFGFDGDNKWQGRRDRLISTLHSNPKAKYVTRGLQFGSEPLFDWVLEPEDLAQEVWDAKSKLADLEIPVTISEMAYGYQEHDGAQPVLDAIDFIDAHILPFFAWDAGTAKQTAWGDLTNDLNWFLDNGQGKKIYFSENGWPSQTSEGVQPNSPNAVADVQNEKDYFTILDDNCEFFKNTGPKGGVGWFFHIYSEEQEPGYGLYWEDGSLKFDFAPRTSC